MSSKPYLVQFALASNLAVDPERRVTLIGVWSQAPIKVVTPAYAMFVVAGIPTGNHAFTLSGNPDSSELDAETVELSPVRDSGWVFGILAISKWTIKKQGEILLNLVMDGQKIAFSSIFCYDPGP